MVNIMWHDDPIIRQQIGDQAEKQFPLQVRCHCGGTFQFVGDRRAGFPDFTCENCGQLVDVKNSPQAERTGNIAVSVQPWEGYHEHMLLVTKVRGQWIGQYKMFIYFASRGPLEPTHTVRATRFHLIPWKQFMPLKELGYCVESEQ